MTRTPSDERLRPALPLLIAFARPCPANEMDETNDATAATPDAVAAAATLPLLAFPSTDASPRFLRIEALFRLRDVHLEEGRLCHRFSTRSRTGCPGRRRRSSRSSADAPLRSGVTTPLTPPYTGPYEVLQRRYLLENALRSGVTTPLTTPYTGPYEVLQRRYLLENDQPPTFVGANSPRGGVL